MQAPRGLYKEKLTVTQTFLRLPKKLKELLRVSNDCIQKVSQYIAVCAVHSSDLAWISLVHLDKVLAWLSFRKICVLKASFSKNNSCKLLT